MDEIYEKRIENKQEHVDCITVNLQAREHLAQEIKNWTHPQDLDIRIFTNN